MKVGPQMTGDSQLQKAGNHLLCVATKHHFSTSCWPERFLRCWFSIDLTAFNHLAFCLVGSWASILFMQRTPEEGRKWIGRKLGQLNKNVAKFKPIPLKDVPALGKYIHS
jgi:hypothetical protein